MPDVVSKPRKVGGLGLWLHLLSLLWLHYCDYTYYGKVGELERVLTNTLTYSLTNLPTD